MTARNILDDPPSPARSHSLVDAGANATALLAVTLFIAPMVAWALMLPPVPTTVPPDFELRMLLWCALLAPLLALVQIYLQIRRFGGAAVRGNRARFPGEDGAAGRVARAHRNLLESLVPFAAAVLAAHALGVSTRWTAAASGMFLAARLVHAASYALGITIVRSAAFYAGLIATVVIVLQLPLRG